MVLPPRRLPVLQLPLAHAGRLPDATGVLLWRSRGSDCRNPTRAVRPYQHRGVVSLAPLASMLLLTPVLVTV